MHRLRGGAYEVERREEGRIESEAVPGFWVKVEWLFQTPLPPVAGCVQAIRTGTL